jgi:hypothetical protein
VADQVARLYLQGKSQWEIVFRKTDQPPETEPELEEPGDEPPSDQPR